MTAAVRPAAAAAPLRLHLSESCYGASPLARAALLGELDRVGVYPDPDRSALRAALGKHLGLPAGQVAVANGSDELVLLTALALGDPDRPGVVTAGTFPGYRICLAAARRGCREVPLAGTRVDVERFAAALPGAGVAYLCNPHNPTGGALTAAEWAVLVDAARTCGVPLVVDEAYLEFAPVGTPQLGDHLGGGAPLLALRTFSKAYGLAGLRIGYALGEPALVAALHGVQGTMPFSANRFGQAAALAALADTGHLAAVRDRNARRRTWLRTRLAARGWRSLPSVTNFVAVQVPSSASVEEGLRDRHGILVRDAGRFGLPGYLRVSMASPEALERFVDALDEVAR